MTSYSYYDLLTTGVGYLDWIKEEQPEQGLPFWKVRVSALSGRIGSETRTKIYCTVHGTKTIQWIEKLQEALPYTRNIRISFCIADVDTELYYAQKGKNTGGAGTFLRGRLISINWVTVREERIELDSPGLDSITNMALASK